MERPQYQSNLSYTGNAGRISGHAYAGADPLCPQGTSAREQDAGPATRSSDIHQREQQILRTWVSLLASFA